MGLNEDLGDRENIGNASLTVQRAREERLDQVKRAYPFLNPDFLTLMNDIGRLGHEKFGADAVEVAGAQRKIPRHRKSEILWHVQGHMHEYEWGREHDKLGNLSGHLAAAAFNAMLEYIFSQGE